MTKGQTGRFGKCHGTDRMEALLGAVWLYSADVPRTVAFYRDAVGLPVLEEGDEVGHFDAGNIRLSIHSSRGDGPVGSGAFYVFIVDDIDAAVEDLSSRGVRFDGGITQEEFGRIAGFEDPDGHELYLWQIPREGEPELEEVRPLVRHYAHLRAALGCADTKASRLI
jgi:predicted enzyme related to lactoylglutathione lyase